MNQAVKSVVQKIPTNSDEYPMIQSICTHAVDDNVTNSKAGKWGPFQKLLIKVLPLQKILFFFHISNEKIMLIFSQVSQSCEEMLITCLYGGVEFKCADSFETVLTDEGLCCTFNGVNKRYIAKQYKFANIHLKSLIWYLKLLISMLISIVFHLKQFARV